MRWLLVVCLFLLAGCEREDREYRPDPVATETHEEIAQTVLSPGDAPAVQRVSGLGKQYEANAYHVSQGKKWFTAFNCNGCHSNGGGGSGPALMDDKWIYGSDPANIFATIVEGRPNGMPSFRGKIPDYQVWQLVAFVQSLSGNVPKDAANGRADSMQVHKQEQAVPDLKPEKEAARHP
jgi:cytochrome c oxidase cbb3-type subunit 3